MSFVFPDQKSQQALLQKVAAQFERGADGKVVFYPNSARQYGYVVDPPEREQALRDYALRRKKIDPILAAIYAIVLPLYFYAIAPRYPWWLTVAIGIAGVASVTIPDWLWRRHVTAGLPKIGEPASTRNRAVAAAIVGAVLIFISVYRPPVNPALAPGTIVFYPDIGAPILVMIFGTLMGFFIDSRSVQLKSKLGSVRYAIGVVLFGFIALGGLGWTIFALTHVVPKVLITPKDIVCDDGTIAWEDVTAMALTTDGHTGEYAELALDPARRKDNVFAIIDGNTFSCAIDGTSTGFVAVYDAIETAWKKSRP